MTRRFLVGNGISTVRERLEEGVERTTGGDKNERHFESA